VIAECAASRIAQQTADASLSAALSRRTVLAQQFASASRPAQAKLRESDTIATTMSSTISQSSQSAVLLSKKIRDLDMVQSRVIQALNVLDTMQDLKNTNDIVEKAIAERNYEVAARHTYRVIHTQKPLENDVINQSIKESLTPSKHL
jgi:predicted ATPase with chaperone activity